jgi:hypothetical protein
LLTAATLPASATPINFTIDFTPGLGPIPTGSFTYDSSLAVGSQFSMFQVDWSFGSFDFTAAANGFAFRTDGGSFSSSCAANALVSPAFLFLSNAQCVADVETLSQWQAVGSGTFASVSFRFLRNSGVGIATASDSLGVQQITPGFSSGSAFGPGWVLTEVGVPVAVPEPGTAVLVAGAIGLMGWRRPRQTRTRSV